MRTYAVVGVVLVVILFARPSRADDDSCDSCEELCELVDLYQQKEAGIRMWKQYAATTLESHRSSLPANLDQVGGVETIVWWQFAAWARERRLPCEVSKDRERDGAQADVMANAKGDQKVDQAESFRKWKGDDIGSGLSVDLETDFSTSDCAIKHGNQKLEGKALEDYRNSYRCKFIADAVIEHERVHQGHCKKAYAAGVPQVLNDPANIAESELQAWTVHKNLLADRIRQIIYNKKCGWQPTEGQRNDPNALPSAAQSRAMDRARKAAKALAWGWK